MNETVKKISRKIRGIPEAELLIGELDEPYREDLPNVEFTLRYKYQPIQPITCPECGKTISKKQIRMVVDAHGFSRRALLVNLKGQQNQKLTELYEKTKKHKISPREFFTTEHRIIRMFDSRKKDEQPISSINQSVPIKCPYCDYKLGLIEVKVIAKPERSMLPAVEDVIACPRSDLEERWVKSAFPALRRITEEEWLQGKDMEPTIEKLKMQEKELLNVPFSRGIHKHISDLRSKIHLTIKKIVDDIRTRKGQLYNILAMPPELTFKATEQLAKARAQAEELGRSLKPEDELAIVQVPGYSHVPSKLMQDLIKRGKLIVKPKTAREKEMQKLGGKPIRR